VYDAFGGYNGYDTNAVQFSQPGALANDANTAILLDGAAAHVQVPHSLAINPVVFSVECWARLTGGAGTYRAAVSSRDYQAGYIIYAGDNNNWQFWTRMPGSSWENLVGLPVVEGEWTHLVATFDGTNKSFYINGALAVTQVNTNYAPNLLRPFRIGAGNNEDDPGAGSIYPFPGNLDEVAIYNYALTPAQVAQHYAVAGPPTLTISTAGSQVVVSWNKGVLLQAGNVTGPWTTNSTAVSPWTNTPSGSKQFFRAFLTQ
jgi:hypothetical protein